MTQFQITTLERVKAKADIAGTSLDALIGTELEAVSQDAELYLGRHLLLDSYTEVRPLPERRRYVSLLGFPLESVTSVKYARNRDFTPITAMDKTEYQVLLAEGQIYLSQISTWLNPGFLQVVYTGGMAADTTAFIAAFPRLAEAADNEIVSRLNRRKAPDGNLTALGSQIGYTQQLKPLDDFYAALNGRRRLRL